MSNQDHPTPTVVDLPNGKKWYQSKEIRLGFIVFLGEILKHFFNMDYTELLSMIADIDWTELKPAIIAALYFILRFFYTKEPIAEAAKIRSLFKPEDQEKDAA